MRSPNLPTLLALVLGLTGCSNLVVFGSRCEDGDRQCEKGPGDTADSGRSDADPDGAKPGEGGTDAPKDGGMDAGDSGGGFDATTDAEPTDGGFDAYIRNRSFELTAGDPGNLEEAGTQIAPWARCPNLLDDFSGLSVVETAGLLSNVGILADIKPTEGDTMFRFSYVFPGTFGFLTQQLETPLPANQTRALTFDLAGQVFLNELRFEVLSSNEACPEAGGRQMLATIQVPQGEWGRDICVEITPSEDVQWVILHPESAVPPVFDAGGLQSQVFVDNLRESDACP